MITLPDAAWTEGSDAAEAWREFSASLEAAGQRVYQRTDDPLERREGLAYLAQMASAALEMKLAKGSRTHPQFTDWMADYRKFLGDSPDAIYHTAELSPDYRYEITGNRGEAEYLGFIAGVDENLKRMTDLLNDPNNDGDSSDSIAENTIVFFTSDNGGTHADNLPLKGKKGMLTEGGIRVPLIARWPGTIEPGTVMPCNMLPSTAR